MLDEFKNIKGTVVTVEHLENLLKNDKDKFRDVADEILRFRNRFKVSENMIKKYFGCMPDSIYSGI